MPLFPIAISFTLNGQDTEKIFKELKKIRNNVGARVELVHGFLPREVVIKKKMTTDVIDMLDFLFPNQVNFYDKKKKKVLREEMAQYILENDGEVFIIGDITGGVIEEYELYRSLLPPDRITVIEL